VAEYRTGNHWGVTIVREGELGGIGDNWRTDAQLVAVVVNGDQALAERICALLNFQDRAIEIWGPENGDILTQPLRVCADCGRTARELIPVQDPDGRVTGWVGPTCNRRRTEAAERGAGTQLPLAQEGAGRG
jgi:hypothetical protein